MSEHQYAGIALTPEVEAQRLVRQAEAHADGTRWLFQQAGLRPGMKVLDVGSGIGAVAMIAAEFVGPAGSVVGVDSNAGVLNAARARALEAGLTNVSFVDADLHSAEVGVGFDALVGRSVLMHVADPVAALRSLSRHLGSGGIVAFREVDASSPWTSIPADQLLQEFSSFWVALVQSLGVHPTMGSDLYRTFVEAGLPPPHMHKDAAIGGGPDWAGYDYLSEMSSAAKTLAQRVGQSSTDRGWWSMCAKRWLRRTACSACRVRSTRGPDLSPHNVARCVWRLAHVEPRVCHRVAPDGLYARK